MLNDSSHIGRLIDEDASLIFTREGIIESHFDSTTYIDMKVHCSVIHKVTFDDVDHFVGLSSAKDDLVIDGRIIASDCKSLHITNDFICTADSFGYIRFLPIRLIRTVTDQIWNSIDWKREENGRLSEDGAMIICTDPNKCSMVIQIIPRGNLETFYPRAFVLSKIRAALSLANYTEAFVLCRRHRIDLNILHD